MTHFSPNSNIPASPDLTQGGWVDRKLPEAVRPYVYLMRLDRPIGTWLLLWPSLWGIVFASGGMLEMGMREFYIAALFCVGAIVMRGAGCIINDLWDRDLDKHVARTQNRPLASGAVTPAQAFVFLACLLFIGLVILVQLPPTVIGLGVLSMLFVITYPLMKRLTYWPQAFLGLTFNFGALMGWASITDSIDLPVLLLYIGSFFWTLGYDTIYAHQDAQDDALMGVRSTALKFGTQSPIWVAGFYALAAILWMLAGFAYGQPPLFFAFILLPTAHLFAQVWVWDPTHPPNCLQQFRRNKITGYLVLLAFSVF